VPAPPPQTLVGWLAAIAGARPSHPALIQDGEVWTYERFWRRSREVADWALGMEEFSPGDAVALVGANEPEYLAAYFGILRAGGVVVPLNPMLSDEELIRHVAFVGALGTIVGDIDATTREALATAAPTWGLAALSPSRAARLPKLGPGSGACILLTSGSTGRPKGVLHTQGTMLHAALEIAMELPFASDERSVAFLPFFASIPEQVLPTLLSGGTLDILRRFDVDRVCAACAEATSFDAVPTIMSRLLDHGNLDQMRALRWVMFASEPMPVPLLERWWDALPGVQTHQLYGMTEMLSITHAPHRVLQAHPLSVGHAFATSTVSVVDPTGSAVPAGTPGEVTCRSPARMLEYLDDPEATVEATTPEGAMRTGDLGFLDDGGHLHLTGRLKDLIISGGLNITPAEIERVACDHPRVAAAVVVGVPDSLRGETPVVVALATAGEAVTAADLLEFCRSRLTGYKRPTAAALVESFPQTGIGKSAKAEIRKRILDGEIELLHV
jgi:acyl-CoA synthetase (AMP-forming)/AMP-acid ligase II